ncbi:MAG: hypothetical protein FGM14_10900 [Flavobacteriales bacterium]|nr:hypothetical protein [Flavobacteriales bacterium]
MGITGHRIYAYKHPLNEEEEDRFYNPFQNSKKKKAKDKEKENLEKDNLGDGKQYISFIAPEKIEEGDPEEKALRYFDSQILGLNPFDYRMERVLAEFNWSFKYDEQLINKPRDILLINSTFIKLLDTAYIQFENAPRLRNNENFLKTGKPFSEETRAKLIQLAQIYSLLSTTDVLYFDYWARIKSSVKYDFNDVRIDKLDEHLDLLKKFLNNKLEILNFLVNNGYPSYLYSESSKKNRAAKLKFFSENINEIPKWLFSKYINFSTDYPLEKFGNFTKVLDILNSKKKESVGTYIDVNLGTSLEQNELVDLEKLFNENGYSIVDILAFYNSFTENTYFKTQHYLLKSRNILIKENEKYQKQEEFDKLFKFLEKTYNQDFDEANELRVNVVIRTIKKFNKSVKQKIPKDSILQQLIECSHDKEKIQKFVQNNNANAIDDALVLLIFLKKLVDNPKDTMFQLETFNQTQSKIFNELYSLEPDLEKANQIDKKAKWQIVKNHAEDFPILADIHYDYRKLNKNNKSDFKAFIIDHIQNKLQSNSYLKNELNDDPELIWKLPMMLEVTKSENGIYPTSNSFQLIDAKLENLANQEFWKNIELAALSIGLGVAGFFTAGTTWLGIGALGGSVLISGYEVDRTIEEYQFIDNARNTSLTAAYDISKREPELWPVILSFAGMLIDAGVFLQSVNKFFSPAGKLMQASTEVFEFTEEVTAKFLTQLRKIEANLDNPAVFRASTEKLYKLIGKGRLAGNPDFETFLKNLQDLLKVAKPSTAVTTKISLLLTQARIFGDDFVELMDGFAGYGLRNFFSKNEKVATRMLRALAGKPKVIFQYSLEMMFDEKFLASIEKIASKIDSDELFERCLIYLSNVERTGLADLSKTLSKLDEAGDVGEELVEEIIVNPKIRRIFNSMDDPKELVDLWHNYYKTKPTQSFSEYVSLQLKTRGKNAKFGGRYLEEGENVEQSWKTIQKITNKYPLEGMPSDGQFWGVAEIENGVIKQISNKGNTFNNVDFVVTTSGELIIGKKHHYLGKAIEVEAAGTIKIVKGKIKKITNSSGHYFPSIEETNKFPEIFRQLGLNTKGASLEIIYLDDAGNLKTEIKIISE